MEPRALACSAQPAPGWGGSFLSGAPRPMAVVSSSTWDVAAWPQGQKKAQTGRRGGRVQAWSTPCVQHLLHTHQPWLGLPCLSWIFPLSVHHFVVTRRAGWFRILEGFAQSRYKPRGKSLLCSLSVFAVVFCSITSIGDKFQSKKKRQFESMYCMIWSSWPSESCFSQSGVEAPPVMTHPGALDECLSRARG